MNETREQESEKKYPVKHSAAFAGSTLVTMGLVDVLAHLGPTGLLVGGIASYVAWKHGPELYEQVQETFPFLAHTGQTESAEQRTPRSGRSFVDRALGRYPKQELEAQQEPEAELPMPDDESAVFVSTSAQTEVPGVPRITLPQIVAHTERNSFEVFIGRSMSRPHHPAVKINFYKRHIKLIGASQHGKSSMAAALLDAITRTHDPELVQIALFDLEDRTSRLFAGLPHITRIRKHGETIRLHARSYEQVLEHLEHVSALIDYRYALPDEELEKQPLVIVYVEEFLDLRNYFKRRIETVGRDERDSARADYSRLIYIIGKIAARGLKVEIRRPPFA